MRYYQQDLLKKIDNHDFIVVDWGRNKGLTYTLNKYIVESEYKIGYFGKFVEFDEFQKSSNLILIKKTIFGYNIDKIIIEFDGTYCINSLINDCVDRNIKIIILDYSFNELIGKLSHYEYILSDGLITKSKDRKSKMNVLMNGRNS